MRLRAGYDQTYQYVRKNPRALTYDVGYQVYQRNDGSYIFGYEVVQESSNGWLGSGASPLQFEGSRQDAEAHVRDLIEQRIERLPDEFESERFRHRKGTDAGAVTDGWLVLRIYGYWPSFHDAELASVSLRQCIADGRRRTDMELTVHHDGQDNPNWGGEKVQCKLSFLLEDVVGKEFSTEDVSVPNWINDLRFSRRDDGRIDIDLDSSSGFSILLHCATARLLSVEPYPNKEIT